MMEWEVSGRRLPSQGLALVIQLHSAAGHDEVNVRMIDQRIASPRVSYAEESELTSAQALGRLPHIADGCGSGIEQRVIARALVSAEHCTDPVRHGHRDQKMLHRQQATRLFGQPGGGLLGPAARAVAIAATSPKPVRASAIVTTISDAAEFSDTDRKVGRRHRVIELITLRWPTGTASPNFARYAGACCRDQPAVGARSATVGMTAAQPRFHFSGGVGSSCSITRGASTSAESVRCK